MKKKREWLLEFFMKGFQHLLLWQTIHPTCSPEAGKLRINATTSLSSQYLFLPRSCQTQPEAEAWKTSSVVQAAQHVTHKAGRNSRRKTWRGNRCPMQCCSHSCPSNWKGNCVTSPSHSPTYPSWQEDPGMNEIMKTGPWTVVIQKGLQSSLFCQHCYSTYCIHDRHSSSTVCILIHLTFTRTLEVGTILITCYRWGNWNGW